MINKNLDANFTFEKNQLKKEGIKMYRRNIISFLTICFVVLLIFSGIGFASDNTKFGGTFRFATVGEAPTLDTQMTSASLSNDIGQHIFEGLYTYNSNYEAVPVLVKNSEIKNEGKLIVLHLREGVPFHNGKELTSEDVVSSLNRWGKYGGRGPAFHNNLEKVEIVDEYTVNLYFKEKFGPWENMLALPTGGLVIFPKEVMEISGENPVAPENYIGTGPYKFVDWKPGRYILLKRFDEYAARDDIADGYGGKKVAYFDEIKYIPVPDVSTRINGVKAGDYDFAQNIPGDFYDELSRNPNINNIVIETPQIPFMIFNSKAGIMKDNFKLRQAIQAALDMTSVLRVAIGPEALWKLNSSWMPEKTVWYSKEGIENYNQGNVEKAKKLAKEAGYNGEKIIYISTTTYPVHYGCSQVIVDQLLSAGFNIDLQIYDWATLVSRRGKPELWDIFFTTHGFYPEPTLYCFMSSGYPGWWNTDKKKELMSQFVQTMDPEERLNIWHKIQALIYEEVPIVKVGDYSMFHIASSKVRGIGNLRFPKLWNAWFK